MSAVTHAREPWAVLSGMTGRKTHFGRQKERGGESLGTCCYQGPRIGTWSPKELAAEEEANAARIVACVNAMEGFDDPAGTRLMFIGMLAALNAVVEARRKGFTPAEIIDDNSPIMQAILDCTGRPVATEVFK